MATVSETAASLRIIGEDLDPDTVTRVLGKKPDIARRRGDVLSTPSERQPVSPTGMWSIQVERRSPGDLDAQISELLKGATSDVAAWKHISSLYKTEIFAGLFVKNGNEGLTLSSETLRLLGERGIAIDFDIYHMS